MTTQTEQQQQQARPFPGPSIDIPMLAQTGVPTPTATSPVQAFEQLQQGYFQLAEDTLRHARRVTETIALSWAKQEIVHEVRQEVMQQVRAELAQAFEKVRDEARYSSSSGGPSSGQQYRS